MHPILYGGTQRFFVRFCTNSTEEKMWHAQYAKTYSSPGSLLPYTQSPTEIRRRGCQAPDYRTIALPYSVNEL